MIYIWKFLWIFLLTNKMFLTVQIVLKNFYNFSIYKFSIKFFQPKFHECIYHLWIFFSWQNTLKIKFWIKFYLFIIFCLKLTNWFFCINVFNNFYFSTNFLMEIFSINYFFQEKIISIKILFHSFFFVGEFFF